MKGLKWCKVHQIISYSKIFKIVYLLIQTLKCGISVRDGHLEMFHLLYLDLCDVYLFLLTLQTDHVVRMSISYTKSDPSS